MNYESKSSANIEIRKKKYTNVPLDMVYEAQSPKKNEAMKNMRYFTHVSSVGNEQESVKSKALLLNSDTMPLENEDVCRLLAVDMVLVWCFSR